MLEGINEAVGRGNTTTGKRQVEELMKVTRGIDFMIFLQTAMVSPDFHQNVVLQFVVVSRVVITLMKGHRMGEGEKRRKRTLEGPRIRFGKQAWGTGMFFCTTRISFQMQ
jgi:hypothetical protein